MLKDSFLNYLRFEKFYSVNTIASYNRDLIEFQKFINNFDEECVLQNVDGDVIRHWIMKLLDSGKKASTINRKLSSLQSFFNFLLQRGEIDDNPMHFISGLKKAQRLPVFLKEKEMNSLFLAMESDLTFEGVRNFLIIAILYYLGLRVSELVNLNVNDVEKEKSFLKVLGKRNKQRLIPYSEEIGIILQQYLLKRSFFLLSEKALFCNQDGVRLNRYNVYRIVNKALSKVTTLKKKSPHVLRHTFATSMLNGGSGLNVVKEILGHENLAATEIYTHVSFKEMKSIYEQAHPKGLEKGGFMNIRIQSIHFDATKKLQMFIEKKSLKLERFYSDIEMEEVVLKVVKPETAVNKEVGIKLKVPNGELYANKVRDTFEEAVDEVVDALLKQLVKYKEKMHGK